MGTERLVAPELREYVFQLVTNNLTRNNYNIGFVPSCSMTKDFFGTSCLIESVFRHSLLLRHVARHGRERGHEKKKSGERSEAESESSSRETPIGRGDAYNGQETKNH